MAEFRGFTSNGGMRILYDVDLVKQGLTNHFYTPLGSLDHNPAYGSIIPLMIFELKNALNRAEIERDVIRVLSSEPRVQYLSHSVTELEHGYSISVSMKYMNVEPTTLFLEFTSAAA